jgi:arsenate reductase
MDILRERNVEFDVIQYLKTPPSESELNDLLQMLPCEPRDLIHPGPLKKLDLNIGDYNTKKSVVALLLEHPEVMNRPICRSGTRAVIAKPADLLEEFLSG